MIITLKIIILFIQFSYLYHSLKNNAINSTIYKKKFNSTKCNHLYEYSKVEKFPTNENEGKKWYMCKYCRKKYYENMRFVPKMAEVWTCAEYNEFLTGLRGLVLKHDDILFNEKNFDEELESWIKDSDELFEKYYKGQAQMIADFWMPNKNWEGCNVDDPSARVLSNYGASGI